VPDVPLDGGAGTEPFGGEASHTWRMGVESRLELSVVHKRAESWVKLAPGL